MSEETNAPESDGTWSGLKKTIIGTLTTVVAGGGVWLSTQLFGGHSEEEATKTEQVAPAAPVVINLQNNNTNQQKQQGGGTNTIVKERTGFYSILDNRKEAIVSSINLPQTAAVIANSLALGKWPADDKLVKADRDYGYNLFEETLSKKHAENSLKNNDVDRADILFIKGGNARYKKLQAHQTIINSFEKLRRLR
jgi:hypothetical protein